MNADYSIDTCRKLEDRYAGLGLFRPRQVSSYDPGTRLNYAMTAVFPKATARVHLEVEKFIGGGFAGQVYRVRVTAIKGDGAFPLQEGAIYALKILIPPGTFARFFRNVLYRVGFWAPFQPQVNPQAARAGALWQKFFRQGAKIRFGSGVAVNDIHATFVDETLGSCGEISDWVEGRTWRLEVDDRLDLLKKFKKREHVDEMALGSPEYRAKRRFMADFVTLLHDMGGHEFARQYEWFTAKSQPNCLKLRNSDPDPQTGLVAVDFRAGLVLLPFLPMSPGDIPLIFKGLARGSLVQFDRGNLRQLEAFVAGHRPAFAGMEPLLQELKVCEGQYRNSMPDVTHNHIRLLYSRKLWATIRQAMITGWQIRGRIDDRAATGLQKSRLLTLLFALLGIIPFLGGFLRRVWGRAAWRKHYGKFLTNWSYFKASLEARVIEKALTWLRAGRIDSRKAEKIAASSWRYLPHLPFLFLPKGLHRFLTDGTYFRGRLYALLIRPAKLYFSSQLREQWLHEMLIQGEEKQILSPEDAKTIRSQIKEPFIQKYLKSLAVHMATLPVTEIGSLIIGWIYVSFHPELTGAQAMTAVAAIFVLFHFTPVSPGSMVRGLYVVYLVIKERNYRDYNIALFLSFAKYIGYLGFPIQMTYRYPELARFMAGHWATEAVHIVPVFGERGALLERWVFDLFYNWPLTIRRRMKNRALMRERLKPRYWHILPLTLAGMVPIAGFDWFYLRNTGALPVIGESIWLLIPVALVGGAVLTLGGGGAPLATRIRLAAGWGVLLAIVGTAVSFLLLSWSGLALGGNGAILLGFWRLFILAVFSTGAAIFTELRLPDPVHGDNLT